MLTYADVCGRVRTCADVCGRVRTYADAAAGGVEYSVAFVRHMLTYADVC
jgi:hypothetical protein